MPTLDQGCFHLLLQVSVPPVVGCSLLLIEVTVPSVAVAERIPSMTAASESDLLTAAAPNLY